MSHEPWRCHPSSTGAHHWMIDNVSIWGVCKYCNSGRQFKGPKDTSLLFGDYRMTKGALIANLTKQGVELSIARKIVEIAMREEQN